MQLNTTRFGTIDVDPNAVITFTQPIIGFQEYRRFIILPGPPDSFVKWLQSTDSGELAFIIMDPRLVMPNYEVQVSAHELTELAVSSVADLDVYTLVVVPRDQAQVRTNLRAPILISAKHRLGKQTILDKSEYPIQYFLMQAQSGAREDREVSDARANA